jgi:hypothetical protein
MVATPLNSAQLAVLKLMVNLDTEQELAELQAVLVQYLYERAMRHAEQVDKERGYTQETFDQWANEHARIKTD